MNRLVSFLTIVLIVFSITFFSTHTTAQDENSNSYYTSSSLDVERLSSRVERFIKEHQSFIQEMRSLNSLNASLLDIQIKNNGIGRYTYIDSVTYFDTKTAEIIKRN